ncbi:MAG: conjugative relaxase, partial [Planctomycetes bacterium]|nr:conjugative relaxase [Planctomycetota bacterium]
MLSIGPINVKTAEHYYEMDDYYAKEDQLGSQWYGKGAEALGFTGAVQKEKFLSLLDGKLPNGQQLGCVRGGKLEHRNGLDLTFSAPKSVSILAELGADNRLFTVHEKAVKATLDYLEKHVIQTRARAGGEIQFVNTQSLVAALFQHDTSRNLDPQLHTHCVVMNATQMENGPWRSLSNEQIYDTKMALGALYRAQLAYELTRLGYSLETKQDALFEIKGVPQNLMEAMSTRRQEIESAIEKFGFKGAAGAAKATLNTRKNKQAIEREALKPTWQAMAKEYGFHPESIIPKGPLLNKKEVKLEEIAKASLLSAAQHLTERESQFTWGDLMRSAAHYGFGKVAIAELEQAFQSQLHRKAFIAMEYKGNRGEQRYTTKEQILHETEVRMLMQQGKNTCQPLLSEITAHAALKSSMLNVKQYQAAFGVLTNTDRVVGIQGYAGVGKTHLLNAVRESVSSNFHTFIGLSPSAAAANELQRNTSITSQTVDAFLLNPKTHLSEKTQDKATQTILVVDEASMLSTQKLSGLLKTAKANDWRVVFVGDMQQLQSVEAGKPFAELQKAGMQIWVVDAIVRQKNESLKAAIYDSIHKDIEAAFSKIGKHVIETSAKDIHEKAAQHW